MTAENLQPAPAEKPLVDPIPVPEVDAVGRIDMTPTWGEIGLLLWRLARSNEQDALKAARSEFMRAFAGMEVLSKIAHTFTPEQRAVYDRVMAEEKAKQDRY